MRNEKRILDKDFENKITGRVSEFEDDIKGRASDFEDEVTGRASEFQKGAKSGINNAQKYMHKKNDEIEAMIIENPISFVLGSFIGGAILGALLSRGSK